MVDAQPVDHRRRRQLEHEVVRHLERRLMLHPQRCELVDVEEAAIVDFIECHPPVGEPIGLCFEDCVQAVDVAIEPLDDAADRVHELWIARGERCQLAVATLARLPALVEPCCADVARWDRTQRIGQPREPLDRLGRRAFAHHLVEDHRIRLRVQRKTVSPVPGHDRSAFRLEAKLDFAAFERRA